MNKHSGFKAIRSLDYVILLCHDLTLMKAFYKRLFEFQIDEDYPEKMTFFRVGALFLGLRKRGRAYDGPSVSTTSASIQISFRVPPADVDLAYGKLVEYGVEIIEPPTNQDWTHRTLFFRDPENNIIEIFADIHPRETLAEPSDKHQVAI